MAIGGLDIGSSGCKCTIFNEDGTVSTYAYRGYLTEKMPSGYFELNPLAVWESVCCVIKKAASEHAGSSLESLCITSFGEVGICVDKHGKILRNSLLYTDFRGKKQSQQFADKLGVDEIVSRSGHIPHPMYSFSKILWLKDNEPDVYHNTDVFLQYSEFILFMLSGEKRVDWSLASRTCMFNIIDKEFDGVLLDAAGLRKSIFPDPIQPGTAAGIVKDNVADELGLSKNTILVLGGQDQICAALGAGVLSSGQAVNGIGTVDCITPLFDSPNINTTMAESGFSCVPYVIPDHYVTYAFNYSGGALLKWYKDNFGLAVLEHIKTDIENPYKQLEQLAPKSPTGLLVLPHFLGAATPYMDTDAAGAILGLTANTDAFTLYRALLEGIAYEAKINIDTLNKAHVDMHRLTVCGGGSRSEMWNQIRADLFNIPIDVLEVEEAGTLGAAILAGRACGMYKSLEDGVKSLVKIRKTYYPDKANSDLYAEQYSKYKKIYHSVKEIMKG